LVRDTLWVGTGTGDEAAPVDIVNGIDNTGKALIWTKDRVNGYAHYWWSTETNGWLSSNTTDAINDYAQPTFNADGVTIPGDIAGYGWSAPTDNEVAWNFKAEPKFFDIQTWTGNETIRQIPHDLTSVPGMIIVKPTTTTGSWYCWHKEIAITEYIQLNSTSGAKTNVPDLWNQTLPTSTNFSINANGAVNGNNQEYVAYLFADEPGVIKCGSYTGSGSSQLIDCGFDAQWVLLKASSSSTGNWVVYDVTRGDKKSLIPNGTFTESSGNGSDGVVFTADSNGFTLAGSSGNINASDVTYIYVAIAAPVVESMTAEQFTEAQLKFATFENRSMVKCGNDAEARRDNLIIGLEEQGYSLTEILKYL
jgi:hypothetical protein